MIRSRFGNEVEITAVLKWDNGQALVVEGLRVADRRLKHYDVSDLRADNGGQEIDEAISKVAGKEAAKQ